MMKMINLAAFVLLLAYLGYLFHLNGKEAEREHIVTTHQFCMDDGTTCYWLMRKGK